MQSFLSIFFLPTQIDGNFEGEKWFSSSFCCMFCVEQIVVNDNESNKKIAGQIFKLLVLLWQTWQNNILFSYEKNYIVLFYYYCYAVVLFVFVCRFFS